jgi:hypothetical protein
MKMLTTVCPTRLLELAVLVLRSDTSCPGAWESVVLFSTALAETAYQQGNQAAALKAMADGADACHRLATLDHFRALYWLNRADALLACAPVVGL